MVTLEMIKKAEENLKGVARRTPLIESTYINNKADVYVKCENLQVTGAFKLRGAYTKISSLSEEERKRGIVAASSGNHAQGASLAAKMLGIPATICMPDSAPLSKVQGTRNNGAEVVLVPGVFDDAQVKAMELVKERGCTFIPPFNDELIITGQGTIGLEILEDVPDMDVVLVPIGGGGICAGVATAVKLINPNCKVYGVEPVNAACMKASLEAGHIVTLDSVNTMADGTAVKAPGDLTFAAIQKYVDGIVTITEEEITAAMLLMMEKHKMIAEGSGALAVAAAMFNKVDLEGKKVACVVSGGNADITTLSRIVNKALQQAGRLVSFSVTLADKPGQLLKLMKVLSDADANIFSVDHDRMTGDVNVSKCVVDVVVEARDMEHREAILKALVENGMPYTLK